MKEKASGMTCLANASGQEDYDGRALVSAHRRTGRSLPSGRSCSVLAERPPGRSPQTLWSFRASMSGIPFRAGGGPQTVPGVPQRGLFASTGATFAGVLQQSGATQSAGERLTVIVLAARPVPSRDTGYGPFLSIRSPTRNSNGRHRGRPVQQDSQAITQAASVAAHSSPAPRSGFPESGCHRGLRRSDG